MAKIHELPEILADQIAAGEVIERPSSVIKELVENSIDANSSRIDILVQDSGLKKIEVIDNGGGIASSDVELAFQRHATSKISDRDDLFRVRTLGFRGEALPSIASVADVSLETLEKNETIGTKIHIKGGKILEKESYGGRNGTRIQVNQLFYNTPARLKYLKSPQTELSVISDCVNHLAMSHPEIVFSLSNNGRTLLKTSGNGNLQQVASAIYGVKNATQLIQIQKQDADFSISGLTSLPKLTRASRNYISILLNGRFIKNNQLTKAIIKGYGSKLMVGRYPISIINIKLDPLLVDVNVHPTKQEVRISKEDQLCNLLTNAIYQQISQERLIPSAIENLKSHDRNNKAETNQQLNMGLSENSSSYQTVERKQEVLDAVLGNNPNEEVENIVKKKYIAQHFENPIIIKNKKQLNSKLVQRWDDCYSNKNEIETKEHFKVEKDKKVFPDLKYIGQLHGTYLLTESDDGFYILDQHAAQERIKYEYYRKEIGNVDTTQQKLLVPIVLTFTVSEALKVQENIDKLHDLGINLEDFGQNTYIIHEHPVWIPKGKEEQIIKQLIEECIKNPQLTIAKFREETAIMISCKQSIKANHHLEQVQAVSLLKQLKQCENPFNCPHGRPTVIEFTNKDMERMFKRIQDNHHSLRENQNSGVD